MKKENPANKKAVIGFIAFIMLLLLVSVVCIFLMNNATGKSYTAYLYQDGILLQTIDLSTVTEEYQLTVASPDGGTNLIEVHPHEIAIIDASCPDHVCVKQGFIRNSMLPITCLPNKLVIQLQENTPGLKPDSITY